VPLQDAEAAAEELERAVQVNGMVGVQIGANVNGMNLDDPSLLPFFQVAEKLQAPIFIHPDNVPALDRIPRYNLRNFIGNPLDTTIAAASLIFGGVLERFPNLKVCLAHGGGFVPYQRGRFARGFKVREEAKLRISRPPDDYLSRMYFDTVIHFEPALRYMVETCGARRVVMGSDYPAAMGDPEPVQFVASSRLKEEEKKLVLSENARELFRLDLKT
jgi:aminocarboxymuconate-semialdehyde decarboxylase